MAALAVRVGLGPGTGPGAVENDGYDPPAGPSGKVPLIVRDAYGVPHVFADNLRDLFFGNGYAMAQDRLFQMDVLRHVGRGELASLQGESALPMDLTVRRELYTEAEREAAFHALPGPERGELESFSAGVNAFIAQARLDPRRMPAEFAALAHPVEDWRPEDTLAIAQFLLDIFGKEGGHELENAKVLDRLLETLGPEGADRAFADLFFPESPGEYTTLLASDFTYPHAQRPRSLRDVPEDQWEVTRAAADAIAFDPPLDGLLPVDLPDPLSNPAAPGLRSRGPGDPGSVTALLDPAAAAAESGFPFKLGSNAAVVGPAFSASGKPLLLGGPQMGYFNPMVPYEIGLHGGGYDAVGMGIGGAPGILIGRNPHVAWSATSGNGDQVDVTAVRLVPGNPRQYFHEGKAREMDCRVETHRVRAPPAGLAPPVDLAEAIANGAYPPRSYDRDQLVCRTVYGPVFAISEDAGFAFSKRRTHRGDEAPSGLLWITLATSRSIGELQDKLENFSFSFNLHVASLNGDIAYLHVGRQPLRDPRPDPRLPLPAGAYDWRETISGRSLPHRINPERGWIVNWNNRPVPSFPTGDLREMWNEVQRGELFARVLEEKIREKGKLTADDLAEVNRVISTRDPFPVRTVPFLLEALRDETDARLVEAGRHLADWAAQDFDYREDGQGRYAAPGHAIYDAWRARLQVRVLSDELGPRTRVLNFDPPTSDDPHAADHGRQDNKESPILSALLGRARHDWFDNVSTPGVRETWKEEMVGALRDALPGLEARFGTPDVDAWKLPRHEIVFVPINAAPAVRIPMVNRPSFNALYDLGADVSWNVLPPGTSGQYPPEALAAMQAGGDGGPHYRDQLDLYTGFAFKRAHLARAEVEGNATETTWPDEPGPT